LLVATGTGSLAAQETAPEATPATPAAPPEAAPEAIPEAVPDVAPEGIPGVLPVPLAPGEIPLEIPVIVPFEYTGAVAIPVEGFDASTLDPDALEAAPASAVPSSTFNFPRLPSGFSNNIGSDFSDFSGPMENLLDGFGISASLSGTYESNAYQGVANPGSSSDDSFVLGLGTTLSYRTQGTEWFLGGTYSGTYNEYLSQSELSAYNQSFGLSGGYTGAFLTSTLSLGFTSDSGANRIYGEVADVVNITVTSNTSYAVSSKSSVNATVGYSMSDSDDQFADTSNFDLGLFGLWKVSPLTQLGPGIRYSLITGDRHPDRSSIGPTFNLNYQAGPKISLNSTTGVNFPSYQGGDSADPELSLSLGANYRASELWGMNLSLVRDVRADPSTDGGFSEVTAIRVGYNRRIRRVSLNVGCGFETTTAQDSGFGTAGEDTDYFTVDASLSMMIFANTTQASLFTSLSDQSGGNAGTAGDGFQCGFSLSRGF
jgi:hypothetical protein